MIVGVPSGIGDVSWVYSKLKHVGPLDYQVAAGWPHRTVPFMELLPEVKSACYGDFEYQDIIGFESSVNIPPHPTWEDVSTRGFGRLLIECNRHLEMGIPLADWCPDLPTDFHYDIKINKAHRQDAESRLIKHPKPWTAISAASYRGSEAWKTWSYEEWSPFLKMWHAEVGGTIFLIGGFWDDLTDSLASDGWPSLVGKTPCGTMVAILDNLDYYIGFSSGLGVLRTVLHRNAFMLWPDHQEALSRSWAPPEMLSTGSYTPHLWRDLEVVTRAAKLWLKRL